MPVPRPCGPDDRDCRQRILHAARDRFAARGFAGTSMQDIAATAGVCKSNVFHHFRSKNALYLAVLRQAAGEFGERLAGLKDEIAPGGEPVSAFQRAHLAHILDHEAVSRLILGEVMDSDGDRARTLATEIFHENFQFIVALLRDGQRSGALRDDIAAEHAAILLVGTNVFYFLSRNVMRHTPGLGFAEAPDAYAATTADIILNGLRPRT